LGWIGARSPDDDGGRLARRDHSGHEGLDVCEVVDGVAVRRPPCEKGRREPAGAVPTSETVDHMRRLTCGAIGSALGVLVYRLVATGDLTLDTGIGRRVRPLGPLSVTIDAPRDTVFDVIAAPYLDRTPRALAAELEVLERGSDIVVAVHRTPIGWGMVATTVESVRFLRPATVSFRLLRGPVPHVVEQFALAEGSGDTRLDYTGELGTDFASLGARWGELVARRWVATVATSLERIRLEAERRAGVGRRH